MYKKSTHMVLTNEVGHPFNGGYELDLLKVAILEPMNGKLVLYNNYHIFSVDFRTDITHVYDKETGELRFTYSKDETLEESIEGVHALLNDEKRLKARKRRKQREKEKAKKVLNSVVTETKTSNTPNKNE